MVNDVEMLGLDAPPHIDASNGAHQTRDVEARHAKWLSGTILQGNLIEHQINPFFYMSTSFLSHLRTSRPFSYDLSCPFFTAVRSISICRQRSLSYRSLSLAPSKSFNMPPKRKRSYVTATSAPANGLPPILNETPIPLPNSAINPPAPKRQASRRGKIDTNPDHNADIVDGKTALRASPDADENGEALEVDKVNSGLKTPMKTGGIIHEDKDSPLSDTKLPISQPIKKKTPTKSSIAAKKGSDEIKAFKAEQAARKAAEGKIKKEDDVDEWDKRLDPDGDNVGPTEDVDIMKKEAARPPPVNSDYIPLPWKGRLGYVSSYYFI
jgi:hypothetical protein